MADTQAAVMVQSGDESASAPDFRRLGRAEQRRILVALIQAGRNDEEIGAAYGLSQWQVRNLRYRLGIKKDRGGNVHVDHNDGPPVSAAGPVLAAFPTLATEGSILSLTMAGTETAEQLAQRLVGLHSLFASLNSERCFEVRVQLTEVAAAS